MRSRLRPPRLASWLVRISLPSSDRDHIAGDLQERFAARLRSRGYRAASRWYWSQAMGIVFALGPARLLDRIHALAAPGTMRAAVHSLLRAPGGSLAAVATLSIGIAAPVAMFALADGTTASLPRDPDDRVVRVSHVSREGRIGMGFPWPVADAWMREAAGPDRALVGVAAFRSGGPVAVGGGTSAATREHGVYATAETFRLLGVTPVIGRLYSDGEARSLPAVLIREDLWEERFARDPGAIGRELRIDGVDYAILGVLPASFGFPIDHRLWMESRGGEDEAWSVVGRLAPDASADVARDHLAGVLAAVELDEAQNPAILRVERFTAAHFAADRGPERSRAVGRISIILVVLTAVNVAAVMVARGVARARETAVRMAIGASRAQIMALTIAEGLLLALGGAALGALMGQGALHLMIGYLESQASIVPYWIDSGLSARSVAIAGLLALLGLAIAGLLPGLGASRTDLDRVLRLRPDGGSGSATRLMAFVVAVEVTLSCFLLTASSVLVQEAVAHLRTGADFRTQSVLTGQFVLEAPSYTDADSRRAFLAGLARTLRADPSVASFSITSALPGKEGAILGAAPVRAAPDSPVPPAQVRSVDAAFFSMLELSLTEGRLITDADDDAADRVAVVNRAFMRRHGIDGVGRRILVDGLGRDTTPYVATVIGVVDDRGATPSGPGRPEPGVYLPVHQMPAGVMYLLARTRDGAPLPEVWHRSVAELDPYLPLGDVLTLAETQRRGHGAASLFTSVFLGLGSATLLVALVGLHGVHAFSLTRRIREIGVRRALGAQEGQVLLENVRRGLRPVWIGLFLGIAPGLLVARAVVPTEPHVLTMASAPVLLFLVSALAVWRPTRKASAADPMEALREG